MVEKQKTITVGYPVTSVYQYLKNVGNYAHHFGSACKIDDSGLVATVEVPMMGSIRSVITKRVIDTCVVMSAKRIGTVLTADLEKLSESMTKIKLSMTVNPDLGFIMNKTIESIAPKALERVADELMVTNFNE